MVPFNYMNTKTLNTILPANEARSNFYRILDEVGSKLRQFTITLRGKQQAVILSTEELQSWQETLDILSEKKLMTDIRKGIDELNKGKGIAEKQANKLIGW